MKEDITRIAKTDMEYTQGYDATANAFLSEDIPLEVVYKDREKFTVYYLEKPVKNAEITVTLPGAAEVRYIELKEHIPMSQRVERFAVDALLSDGRWVEIAAGTTVGYRRILRVGPVTTDAVRVRILDSRVCPVLSFIGVY